MFSNRRHQQQLQGFLVGLAVTASCTAFFFAPGDEHSSELIAFDWRMRNFNTLEPDPRIVHVDIDDNSVDRIERWPWKRRTMAELIRTVSEFGPRLIMVDFLFSEPEQPYYEDPRLEALPGDDVQIVGEISEANIVHGDLELAEAVRTAGNVIMSTQLDILAPQSPDTLEQRVRSALATDATQSVEALIAELRLPDEPAMRAELERITRRHRLAEAMQLDFTLDESALAERTGIPADDVSAVLAGVKTDVARRRVRDLFQGGRVPDRDEVLSAILGDSRDRRNADRRDVISAYNRQVAIAAIREALPPLAPGLADMLYRASEVVPLLHVLAEAAFDVAAVNFSADPGGSVRRVPILIAGAGAAFPHLGLAAAAHALELDLARVTVERGKEIVIPSKQGEPRRLPLDGNGGLIIHWAGTAKDWREGRDIPHISAAKLMSLAAARRAVNANNIAMRYKLADVVAASRGEFVIASGSDDTQGGRTGFADSAYRRKVAELIELERSLRLARLQGSMSPEELKAADARLASLRAEIEAGEQQAISAVKLTLMELAEIPEDEIAADPQLAADAKRFREAQRLIDEDVTALRRANEAIEREAERVRAELANHIKDKFVFLGFAATAQGDIVTTPIDARTNGVMCHAHVFNAILKNRPIRIVPAWIGVAICLAGGAVVSIITSTQSPRLSLASTLGLMLAFAAANCELLFKRMDIWAPLAAPETCIFLSWAFVTLYRQLTAEREKRLFAKQLGQYTSPIIAAKLAENPQAAQAFKTVQTRDITAFFSDLKGFTTLTEEEDPEVIQHVLNAYLHRMSEVIWSRHGLLNKFMGDGIMAFFNASVDPMEDHPRAAVETSLLAMEELEKLKVEQAGDPAARIFSALEMRVGLASGLAKNGDMGSELKADYTIIGDVVNLAARLEPANKVFGTSIMVSGATRDAVKDHYDFRYLAELQVKGKARTVPVYEVVCRKGQLTEEQKEYIDRFEAGIELYKARKWDECIVHFTRMLARRFDDPGASRYIDACQEFKQFPPDEAWCGALELKEK